MPAPTYIEHLMVWVQGNIDNEAVFPSRIGECTYLDLFSNAATDCSRCPVSKVIPVNDSTGFQEDVPSVCAHILPPLPCCERAGIRGPFEHKFQTLRALY